MDWWKRREWCDDSRAIEGYDLIGDVHGCAQTLRKLLDKLGYRKRAGVYFHPIRQAIFLGDIIDRGPRIREALHIVKDMVDRGAAHMVLGNHELNALAFTTPNTDGSGFLRSHTPAHVRQINETLQQFEAHPAEWQEFLRWFSTLPLFLELTHAKTQQVFRAVHACWDARLIAAHEARYKGNGISPRFLHEAYTDDTVESLTRWRLTSGVDLNLPPGMSMTSMDGYVRTGFRTKFWESPLTTYGDLLFQPDPLPELFANTEISFTDREKIVQYGAHEPPLFVGHYWLTGQPAPLAPNLACLDYSAVKYGRLVAYRMDGESRLKASNFVWINVEP